MITREKVSEMIEKHFENKKGKNEFLDELFYDIHKGSRYGDDNVRLIKAISTEDYKKVEIELETYNTKQPFTLYIQNESLNNDNEIKDSVVLYFGTEEDESETYGYQFYLDCIGNVKKISIEGFRNMFSHSKFRELLNLEFSIKNLSKYFSK